MYSSNCCFLTCIQISQEAGQVVWYSHLFQNFPQFFVIHTVKGFGIVNKAEIDVFLELSCFFHDPEDIDKAMLYFAEHYNEDICIEDYAEEHLMSTSWFIRNFKQYTGSTPMQYILSKRISNAETLLRNEHYNITEISNIVGYDNPLYFSRIFKKIKGISPTEYRKHIM